MGAPCSFCFIRNGGESKKLKSFFKTSPISSDNTGNHLSSSKHVALDASMCTTEQLLSKIQTTTSNVAVVEQSSSGAIIISTSTTVLSDQPLLTIAKEGSPDQHNSKLSKQPSLDVHQLAINVLPLFLGTNSQTFSLIYN